MVVCFREEISLRPGSLPILLAIVVASMLGPPASSAQTCSGSTCPLGGQLRLQIGNGVPLPISLDFPRTGLITSQPGAIAAVPGATIMQGPAGPGTPATDPRSLMLAPGQLTFDQATRGKVLVVAANLGPYVATNLDFSFPATGLAPSRPQGTVTFAAGGRTGPPVVSWCVGSPPPTASFNPGCLGPATNAQGGPTPTNGLIRFTATRNQFGGPALARRSGWARANFNIGGLLRASLPCSGGLGCQVGVSSIPFPATGIWGPRFASPPLVVPTFTKATGVYTASIGPNFTVFALGTPITSQGQPIPFTAQPWTSWGVPWTTGRLTISVTAALNGPEVFVRTGADGRNAAGSGIVTLVSGALSSRPVSGQNGNRAWLTLKIPEPRVGLGAFAALAGLFAAHRISRERRSGSTR